MSLSRARTERRQHRSKHSSATRLNTVENLDSKGGALIPAESWQARKNMELAEPKAVELAELAQREPVQEVMGRHTESSRRTGD